MKKVIFGILLFFSFQLNITALINNYDMEINLLDDGRLFVTEVISMEKPYNGIERNFLYEDIFNAYYLDLINTGESYNHSIELDSVKAVNYTGEETIQFLYENGDEFELVDDANKGDYGVYTVTDNDKLSVKVYNDCDFNKDILISYYIDDLLVKHLDTYELLYGIFSPMKEDIKNMTIKLNIPFVENVYFHRIDGKFIITEDYTELIFTDIYKNSSFDFRVLFDSDVPVSKLTEENLLTKIDDMEKEITENINLGTIEYQKLRQEVYELVNKAKETNNRNDYEYALEQVARLNDDDSLKIDLQLMLVDIESKLLRNESYFSVIFSLPILGWLVGILYLTLTIFDKYKKCQLKELREYSIYEIYYVKNKKVTRQTLIYLFISLVNKKIIFVKQQGSKVIYQLDLKKELTDIESKMVKIFFSKKSKISLDELLEDIKHNHKRYVAEYSKWNNFCHLKLENEGFYLDLVKFKTISTILNIIALIIYFTISDLNIFVNPIILLIGPVIYLVFTFFIKVRSPYGKLVYNKLNKNDYFVDIILNKRSLNNNDKVIEQQLNSILSKI